MTVVERVVTLREGEDAPAGWEVARILGERRQPVGPGTEHVTVYTVAIRQTTPASLTGVVEPR